MADIATMPRIAPSKPNYFVGHPMHDGSGLTKDQVQRENATSAKLADMRARYDLPHRYKVTVRFEPRSGQAIGEKIDFTCPVVQSSRDRTRICVIAPNGLDYWTDWK